MDITFQSPMVMEAMGKLEAFNFSDIRVRWHTSILDLFMLLLMIGGGGRGGAVFLR